MFMAALSLYFQILNQWVFIAVESKNAEERKHGSAVNRKTVSATNQCL